MSKKTRYTLFAIMLIFPWVSQLMFPSESIWEPVGWTMLMAVLIFVIEKWGKP